VESKRIDKLLHGEENVVCAEDEGRQVIWQIAARRSSYKKHGKRSALYKALRKIEKAKAQVRAKVEHPFRVIKRQFGYTKVRFRGLVKNTVQMVTLFALSKTGEVHLSYAKWLLRGARSGEKYEIDSRSDRILTCCCFWHRG
jgi:IS5 family transposase